MDSHLEDYRKNSFPHLGLSTTHFDVPQAPCRRQKKAYGSTMCWDTVDMIVVGCDTKSMKTVIKRLKEIGGGGVYAIGERVVAEFPAPLGGLLSLKPMEKIRDETKRLKESLRQNGVKWENPVLTVDTLSTAAIPHLRITHHGYVRLKDRKELSLEV